MERERVNSLNAVTLAYIGDAVFSLFVRAHVVESAEYRTDECNRKVTALVRATAQSAMLEAILPELNEEERDVARRGRNCHTPAKAKNTGIMDYKRATALEALFGWLYLRGDTARLTELETKCVTYGEVHICK